jgi:hypothetical protein
MPHNFSSVEALEFKAFNSIFVPFLYGLENHVIIDSLLPAERFLIVYLNEQTHLLVVGGPVIF